MADNTSVIVKSSDGQVRRRAADVFEALQEDLVRRWDQGWPFGPAHLFRPWRRLAASTGTWLPSTDIYEKDGNIVVKTELPGVKKEDVQVSIEGNDLLIQGKREAESEIHDQDYYWMERSSGSFYRRIPLAFEPATGKVQASFKDGVLELSIPKPAGVKPSAKQIPVS